ncbi:tetratricopeptide repeat protein [Pontibacter cellulosilyticus]|uniref:Tetratricopeptide repeat protein n=1 Tax=Pontibacter cellulosilyticus TaxID=1720253 RepID=A0A923N968_9BACT|nr:tetratricopeptide repeat protein [Pontibacter cellulosilyticus]MBC5994019.1 tetratricopeptide repeat protein [Pontibacter cellulosilyticus]
MRYVPDLIPKASRVLPSYFQGSPYAFPTRNKFLVALSYLGAAFFFLGALAFLKHPFVTLLLGAIGFLLLPQGHRWLERKGRFQFKRKAKAIVSGSIFLVSTPFINHYAEVDAQEAHAMQVQEEKARQEQLMAAKVEAQRKDSLHFYLAESVQLKEAKKATLALARLQHAEALATEAEKDTIQGIKSDILTVRALTLVSAKKYKAAAADLTTLIDQSPTDGDLLYNRALCYSKLGKTKEAVADLKTAIEVGHVEANKLHERINPLKKRVAYYVTRCCDGTTSSATGRGACSHHGGVCDWNDPVYEEYRKY